MDLVDKLENLMKKNSIKNILSLSNSADIPYTTLKSIFNREVTDIRLSTGLKLANFFNVSLDYLLDDKISDCTHIDNDTPINNIDISITKKIPILKGLSIDSPILSKENIFDYIYIQSNNIQNTSQDYFAIEVKEDNMVPILSKGDLAIVHIQNTIESGQTAILFEKDKKEFTIKKIIKAENEIELHSINPYYPITKYKSINDITIIGRVIKAEVKKIFE